MTKLRRVSTRWRCVPGFIRRSAGVDACIIYTHAHATVGYIKHFCPLRLHSLYSKHVRATDTICRVTRTRTFFLSREKV